MSRNHAPGPERMPFGAGVTDFPSDPAIPGYPSAYA